MKSRKVIGLIISLIICMIAGTSCSGIDNNQNQGSNESANNEMTENTVNVDDAVIEALQNNNANAIKNLFSDRAIERSSNLDEEISKMLNIYKGKFERVTQRNFGSETHSGADEYKCISPVCVFKTTENYYKLTWNEYITNKKNQDLVGVYSMKFEVWEDEGKNQGGEDLYIAGLISSDNTAALENTRKLLKAIQKQDLFRLGNKEDYLEDYKEEFKQLFSDTALSSITEEQIDSFFENAFPFVNLPLGEAWVEYDENEKMTICILSDSDKTKGCYILFKPDDTQMNKIGCMQIGKITESENIKDIIPNMKDAGINLPE